MKGKIGDKLYKYTLFLIYCQKNAFIFYFLAICHLFVFYFLYLCDERTIRFYY